MNKFEFIRQKKKPKFEYVIQFVDEINFGFYSIKNNNNNLKKKKLIKHNHELLILQLNSCHLQP